MYEAAASCSHRSGSRNKLGTPLCNARGVLLRREVLDEGSARNSLSCRSLATLRRYGTWQRYNCVPTFKRPLFYDAYICLSLHVYAPFVYMPYLLPGR
jgi:hypothetical protein